MSGLPFMTFSAPGVPLYAPASGGGGGSVGPNPAFSSITVATGAILCPSTNISLISPAVNISTLSTAAVYLENVNASGQYPYRLRANSGGVLLETGGGAGGDLNLSTITVSSINGAQYPPASTDVFSTVTAQSGLFSSITAAPGGPNNINTPGNFTVGGDVFIPNGSVNTVGVNVSTLTTFSINGSNAANLAYQNNAAFFSSLGANSINSKIQNTTYPAGVSSLVALGMWGNAGVTPFNWIQAGYVEGLPYASTVLFSRPYPDDNSLPAVMLTPTNFQVTGGNNPNISLNAGYGIGGVSTVGFSVDARDAGNGYSGAFYWMAVPQTQ